MAIVLILGIVGATHGAILLAIVPLFVLKKMQRRRLRESTLDPRRVYQRQIYQMLEDQQQMRAQAQAQRRRFQGRTLEELMALSPQQFEEAICTLLGAMNYHSVQRVGGAGDLGVDVVARDPGGRSVVVQCKRYAPGNRVGSSALQQFIGMVFVHHRVDRGIFVTTSGFTQPALTLASQHGIMLIDGAQLVQLMEQAQGYICR